MSCSGYWYSSEGHNYLFQLITNFIGLSESQLQTSCEENAQYWKGLLKQKFH